MNTSFEDFLKEYHCKNSPEVLDDDLPDAYEAWVSELEPVEIMELAEKYGRAIKIEVLDDLNKLGTILTKK